jgi:hypothetical protein
MISHALISIIHAVKMGDGQTHAGIFGQNITMLQLQPPVIAAQGWSSSSMGSFLLVGSSHSRMSCNWHPARIVYRRSYLIQADK